MAVVNFTTIPYTPNTANRTLRNPCFSEIRPSIRNNVFEVFRTFPFYMSIFRDFVLRKFSISFLVHCMNKTVLD